MENAKRAAPGGSGSSKPALMSARAVQVNDRVSFGAARGYLNPMTQPASPIGVFIAPVTPLQQNCTVVWCTKTNRAAVIDPGGGVDMILA